nr:endonuclease III [Actinomycetota bacterium]
MAGRVGEKRELQRRTEILRRLEEAYPGTARQLCELEFADPFQLLVATILSAQCTDQRVNMVTRDLFSRYPTPEALASADPEEVERIVHPTGFFRAKAANVLKVSAAVAERGGEVPSAMEELTRLPGVGRKTANVVISVAFGEPGLPVDTHVARLAKRLGLTASGDPVKIEAELMSWVPPAESGGLSLRLILHGRRV